MATFYMGVVVPATIFLPIIIALINKAYWKTTERWVFAYLVFSLFFNSLSKLLSDRRINNLPFLHLYTVLEFLLLSLCFLSVISHQLFRKVIVVGMILFPLFAAFNIWHSNSLYSYNMMPRSVESILIIIYGIFFLLRKFSLESKTDYDFNYFFVFGMLLYFCSSITLFSLSGFILQDTGLNFFLWNMHATLVLILYVVIAVGYLKLRRKQ